MHEITSLQGKQPNLNRHLLKMNKANIKHNAKDFRQIMYIFSGVLANQAAASLNKCKLDLNSMMKGTFFCHMLKRDSKNYHPSTFCETEQHDHSIKYLLLCSLEDIHV